MSKKILIVDDSSVARMMIKSCIPSDGKYEIMTAVDGREGVEKYIQFKPDVTFMDITMPETDGFQAIEEIIAFDKNAVILAITADIQPRSIDKIIQLGAQTVIKKPPKPDLIKEALQSVFLKE
jgi:two-component system chemotaxis response regulator CheY